MDWKIIATLFGMGLARVGLFEYRLWKRNRPNIPLDWNPRTQLHEPDFKLKRFEMWAKVGIFLLIAAHVVIGYNVAANGWLN